MTACVLCLSTSYAGHLLQSPEGVRQNIRATIIKHFSFSEVLTAGKDASVCRECWACVRSFEEFHQRVSGLHQVATRSSDSKSVQIEFCGQTEVEVEVATNPLFSAELDALAEGFFAPSEVKVEVNELEPLPKLELLEDPVDTETRPATKRRGSPNDGSPHPKRRIKNERPVDSDSDAPLADFLSSEVKSSSNGPAKGLPLRRSTRRGRPPKAKPEPPASPKKELDSDEEDDDVDDAKDNDMEFVAPEAVLGTDDSGSSSSDSSGEDSDHSLPDIEPEERYAEIPKRVVVKPKKYRKREKPLVPPVRLSREEIERRKLQQSEYDEIILQFFKKFPCAICNLLVQNFADMRRHQRLSHNIESGWMQCCGRKFHIRKALAEHVLVHKNPEHFMCSQCGRVFQDSRSLEVHEQTHANPEVKAEPKEKPVYQCEKCPKSFITKAAIEYHYVSKHVPKSEFKYSCPECNKKIPTERKLKEHLKYMHDPETAIICDKCGKTLRSQTNLKKHHELEHSEEPRPKPDPVQCEICGTWLRHLSGLKQHMNTVHEPPGGEHRCHICNKTSTNSRALKRHIYHNHLCERKFKCGMCEKAFKRPQDLREHTSTHTGEVLYTCPNCPMTFFSNANMYKHRQRLHRAEWEADRKKPLPPNIMKISQGATSAMKKRQTTGAALFPQSQEQKQ
ncbi:transcription factor grauzone [Drosophila takahashii]|uniref:transcription factor grauzone n=1 Tax=Drosophila takahashii TaxID=29030 RepID=UPI001CF8692E|nr:zinc finger protein weckle [Drosophila takahashii]